MKYNEPKTIFLAHPSEMPLAGAVASALQDISRHLNIEVRNALMPWSVDDYDVGPSVLIATPTLLAAPEFKRLHDTLEHVIIGPVLVSGRSDYDSLSDGVG